MLSIAGIHFSSPFVLAPLAGYTDLPFRLLCRKFGAGYCVSEMISCHGLCYRQAKTIEMLKSIEDERPVAFQLFGADPQLMGEAAAIASSFNPDILDINMGCPVKKVTKRGAGAALMGNIPLAEKIISQVVQKSDRPVTVKFRAGTDSKNINCVDFGIMAENAGASAVVVHGRTWAQGFTGSADRSHVKAVKKSVAIPVIGNGDVCTHQQGLEMMAETGCDGVMVGRAALGNPWIFSEDDRPESHFAILSGALQHVEYMEQFLPTDRLLGCIKNHLGRYFKGLPGSSAMRRSVYECPTFESLKILLQTERERHPSAL